MASTSYFQNDTGIFRFSKEYIYPHPKFVVTPRIEESEKKGFIRRFKSTNSRIFNLNYTGLSQTDIDNWRAFLEDASVNYSAYLFRFSEFDGSVHWVRFIAHEPEQYNSIICSDGAVQLTYNLSIQLEDEN